MYHKILLALAVASFLAELAEMTWLAVEYGPPFGNFNNDALSSAIFFNALVVITEFAKIGIAGTLFHYGKMVTP